MEESGRAAIGTYSLRRFEKFHATSFVFIRRTYAEHIHMRSRSNSCIWHKQPAFRDRGGLSVIFGLFQSEEYKSTPLDFSIVLLFLGLDP